MPLTERQIKTASYLHDTMGWPWPDVATELRIPIRTLHTHPSFERDESKSPSKKKETASND